LPNNRCVVQKFIVLETGQPTYELVNEALEFGGGREVLQATLNSTQLSPEFADGICC